MAYQTLLQNLYSFTFERATLLGNHLTGIGLIVQLTSMSSELDVDLQSLVQARATFILRPRRPESIFDVLKCQVAIWLSRPSGKPLLCTSASGALFKEEKAKFKNPFSFS